MTDTWKNLEGQKDEIVGKVKEVYGKAVNDPKVQAEGITQQAEGEVKQVIASGRGNEEEIRHNAKDRASEAFEAVKRQVTETRESIDTSSDENLKEAIDKGKEIKEEAARQAEELRQNAVREGELKREEARAKSTDAYTEAEQIEDKLNQTIEETIHSDNNNL